MKNSRDGKSYSTNLAYTPPEYLKNGELLKLVNMFFAWMRKLYIFCVLFVELCGIHMPIPYMLFPVVNKLVFWLANFR